MARIFSQNFEIFLWFPPSPPFRPSEDIHSLILILILIVIVIFGKLPHILVGLDLHSIVAWRESSNLSGSRNGWFKKQYSDESFAQGEQGTCSVKWAGWQSGVW